MFSLAAAVGYRHGHQKRAAEDRVRQLAAHDVLTGALNGASFEGALRDAARRRREGGAGFAVLCIDLDHFKEVNDTLGHPAGDEFAVLQAGVDGSEAVAGLAGRITESLLLQHQPVFEGDGRELTGHEALARWPHPTRGFDAPARCIALAEQTGLIDELGLWMLRTACREAAGWPARLELEMTESLLLTHTESVLRSLEALHAMGVRIAMDDFGTGYSRLACLWKFPFDKLEIDRAFTQGVGADGKVDLIVRSIVSRAHSLKIRVNVEGVETTAQRHALAAHGADELQGYLLGKPLPADRLPHKLARPDDSAVAV